MVVPALQTVVSELCPLCVNVPVESTRTRERNLVDRGLFRDPSAQLVTAAQIIPICEIPISSGPYLSSRAVETNFKPVTVTAGCRRTAPTPSGPGARAL